MGVSPLPPQALLAAIVESSNDAILSKDLNGTITSWNSAATRIFGYESAEVVGGSILRLVPEDLHPEEASILQRLSMGQRIEHYETVRLHKSGERLDVSLTISPIEDISGKVVGASKIVRDISERKRMERLMLQTEKIVAAGRMAATIAHEINNPLEAIVNLIYLARMSPTVDDQTREYLKLAEQEIERVSVIARQTLGFFRESTHAEAVQVSDILHETLMVYSSKLNQHLIRVQRAFEPVSHIFLRRGEMAQVFANIISNAIDAMPDGGDLRVAVAEDISKVSGGVRVRIHDGGTGIGPDDLGRIFEPLFTTKQQRGTGIGLWISRQFVEAHGGVIEVASKTNSPGQGTCFDIFLPYDNGLQAAVHQGTGRN